MIESCKRPVDALHVYALLYVLVLQNIVIIVVGKEIVVAHALIGKNGNHSKKKAHSGNLPRLMDCEGMVEWSFRPAILAGCLPWDLRCCDFFAMIGNLLNMNSALRIIVSSVARKY